jgi:hypothetical protein
MMADFAPNFTARYVVRYSVLGIEHTTQYRIARGSGATGLSNMVAKVAAFYDALKSFMFVDWTILDAKYSAEDSSFFSPAASPTQPVAAVALPSEEQSQSILSTSFVGLSLQGQKARMFVYGLNIGPENIAFTTSDDFRVVSSDTATLATAIAILNNGSPNIVASDNQVVTWYQYVNTKYNDFHLRAIRG